jgi:hypothetical protein
MKLDLTGPPCTPRTWRRPMGRKTWVLPWRPAGPWRAAAAESEAPGVLASEALLDEAAAAA